MSSEETKLETESNGEPKPYACQVRLPLVAKERLDTFCVKTGISRSSLVRFILDEYLTSKGY